MNIWSNTTKLIFPNKIQSFYFDHPLHGISSYSYHRTMNLYYLFFRSSVHTIFDMINGLTNSVMYLILKSRKGFRFFSHATTTNYKCVMNVAQFKNLAIKDAAESTWRQAEHRTSKPFSIEICEHRRFNLWSFFLNLDWSLDESTKYASSFAEITWVCSQLGKNLVFH